MTASVNESINNWIACEGDALPLKAFSHPIANLSLGGFQVVKGCHTGHFSLLVDEIDR